MTFKKIGIVSWLVAGLFSSAFSQQTVVQGKVTDAASGDPLPYVNVIFKGTTIGTTTDFDGNYALKTDSPSDSLQVTYIGYKTKSKKVEAKKTQTLHFQLAEDATILAGVQINAGENPAYRVLRNVVKNKNQNDKKKLSAYEYDTYTKTEIDIDNISDKLRQKKVMKKISQVLDSIDRIAGEDGKPILPLLITESVSRFYFRDNPQLKKEQIRKSKVQGSGGGDGTLVTQMVGGSFQEYNFYNNWITILQKEFVSPIADGWRLYYHYDLMDSLLVGDDECYKIDFRPKSPQELAFTGTMWITKKDFALRQMDAATGKSANLNFIEKIKIQQELQKIDSSAWLPVKNRILIDVSEIGKNNAGMLAKFYTSNRNFLLNKPKPPIFYEHPIEMNEDVRLYEDNQYWDTLRHEPLTDTEKNVYKMIDTLKNIPIVKTYTDIIRTVVNGYYRLGKIDIGPYLGFVTFNNIEGFRYQVGFRTNYNFSHSYIFSAAGGYGYHDERMKYNVSLQKIISRKRWTVAGLRVRYDLFRLGLDEDNFSDNPLFLAATRWGTFRRGYYSQEVRAMFQREWFKGFSTKFYLSRKDFEPTYAFGYVDPENTSSPTVYDQFTTTELVAEARYGRDEIFIQSGNDRISLGTRKWPVLTFRYRRGIKGLWGGEFHYDNIRFSLFKKVRTGPLGNAYMTATGEYVFNRLPYPLLALHLGNQSALYSPITYNLMNFGEFISDHYISLQWRQYMEGFLLNRIPLIQRLKWRVLATANVIMGGMRAANRNLIATTTPNGLVADRAGYLSAKKPYIELGYGVENIFKFLRVDFVHRLSYLDNPDARRFGILFTAQFQL